MSERSWLPKATADKRNKSWSLLSHPRFWQYRCCCSKTSSLALRARRSLSCCMPFYCQHWIFNLWRTLQNQNNLQWKPTQNKPNCLPGNRQENDLFVGYSCTSKQGTRKAHKWDYANEKCTCLLLKQRCLNQCQWLKTDSLAGSLAKNEWTVLPTQ